MNVAAMVMLEDAAREAQVVAPARVLNEARGAGCPSAITLGPENRGRLVCEVVGPHVTCEGYAGGKKWMWKP